MPKSILRNLLPPLLSLAVFLPLPARAQQKLTFEELTPQQRVGIKHLLEYDADFLRRLTAKRIEPVQYAQPLEEGPAVSELPMDQTTALRFLARGSKRRLDVLETNPGPLTTTFRVRIKNPAQRIQLETTVRCGVQKNAFGGLEPDSELDAFVEPGNTTGGALVSNLGGHPFLITGAPEGPLYVRTYLETEEGLIGRACKTDEGGNVKICSGARLQSDQIPFGFYDRLKLEANLVQDICRVGVAQFSRNATQNDKDYVAPALFPQRVSEHAYRRRLFRLAKHGGREPLPQ